MTKEEWIIQARATLFDAIIGSGTLEELTRCAYTMLGNPICVASANGEIICYVNGGRPTNDTLWERHLASGFITKDVKHQTERTRSAVAGHSFIWEREMGRYRIMMNNSQERQGISLRIVMLESNRPFTETDKEIFELFADSANYFMRDTELARNFDSNSDEYFLYEILSGRISVGASATEISDRLGLRENDRFALFPANMNSNGLYSNLTADIKKAIQCIFPNSVVIAIAERLVCFIILRDGKTVSNRDIIRLSSLANRHNMQICLSRTITDINSLNTLFQQSLDMLGIGVETAKNIPVFLADSMSMTYLLSKLKREQLEPLCYRPLRKLFESDKRNGTELIKTLYAYLLSFGSISAAAKLLGIHYNSMRQRVRGLEEAVVYDIVGLMPALVLTIKALQLLFPEDLSALYELDYRYRLQEGEGGANFE